MIKEFLENLKDGNKLKEYVLDYYIDDCEDDDIDNLIINMEDLQKYGCISGMISGLVYYDDTTVFYENYKDEINELLSNIIENTDNSLSQLFGEKFDESDPLILNYTNKNLMAWFGFEETANSIYEQVYEKYKQNDFEYSN